MTATLVLVRHGKSVWNAKNRFTGWVDVPLNEQGWSEAQKAGEILKDYKWDIAYTSHLQRALLTLHVILKNNTQKKSPIFLPAVGSTPRQSYYPGAEEFPVHVYETALSERHYGDLQGKIKNEVKEEVGEEQFLKWRRGYDTPPPNGESLKDTFDRVVPFFTADIMPHIFQNKTILISAHGNSLRALTKYLENISDKDIVHTEIATGTPIVYTLSSKNGELKIENKEILTLS